MSQKTFFLFACLLLAACAQVRSPTGGERDTTPPKLVRAEPPLQSTFFSANKIELEFDEYVELNDPYNQIIVSPPLEVRPSYTLKKRSLIIDLKGQQLRKNTTYIFQLGQAVRDYNERNPAGDLSYVFSTGAALDSALVVGRVYNSFSLEPVENAAVLLYQYPLDSAYRDSMPDYFGITNKTGNFSIPFLPSGEFEAIAITEDVPNYRYDAVGQEAVGYPKSSLLSSSDSTLQFYDIPIFKETPEFYLENTDKDRSGYAALAFNGFSDKTSARALENPSALKQQAHGDSLFLQWTGAEGRHKVEISNAGLVLDTIKITREEGKEKALGYKGLVKKKIGVEDSLALQFYGFLQRFDPSGSMLKQDSLRIPFTHTLEGRDLRIAADWAEGEDYFLEIPAEKVTGYERLLQDTLRMKFSTVSDSEFGLMKVIVKREGEEEQLILQLLENGEVSNEIVGDSTRTFNFTKVLPGSYTMRLIVDENEDGKWTTGNFWERKQPEALFLFQDKIEIRSRWEQEIEWEIKDANAQP